MNLYIRNNTFWFELENLTRLFFPNEKINVYREFQSVEKPFILASLDDEITVSVAIGDFEAEKTAPVCADNGENELSTVKLLYQLLRNFSGVDQPWGLLTGVRPIKLLRSLTTTSGSCNSLTVMWVSYVTSSKYARYSCAWSSTFGYDITHFVCFNPWLEHF